jgi:hypothetical protein
VGPHGTSRAPDALLLRKEGGDVGLRLGALGGPGVGVQRVLRHDAPHDGVDGLPLPAVLQLQCMIQHTSMACSPWLKSGMASAFGIGLCYCASWCVLIPRRLAWPVL